MQTAHRTEYINTIVIGGGQAGLSAGYHLKQRGVPFVILDASARIGDAWRRRWDSLRLFTPAKFAGLDGKPFPAPPDSMPSKDEMADYLEAYAREFALPVQTGARVERLSRQGSRFLVVAGERRFEAENVIVAMSSLQRPRTPPFASELHADLTQLHVIDYRNPAQLRDGGVLIVGAGNSGAEIALETTASGRQTWLAGPDTGHVPWRLESLAARLVLTRLVTRVVFHRILAVSNPIGRAARPKMLKSATPLIRVKPADLVGAGVQRVPRMTGVSNGLPLLEDGRVLEVANVIWCTGFHPGFSWIDLPVFDPDGEPRHDRGIVASEPGLYFVGLKFLYSLSSETLIGVGRDAARIAAAVAARVRTGAHASRRPTAA